MLQRPELARRGESSAEFSATAETVPIFSGHIRYFDERKRASNSESFQ